MADIEKKDRANPWSPGTYLVEVEGWLEDKWSEQFGGMQIRSEKRKDQSVVTTLTGKVVDQSELLGILNSLAELHLPILRVTNIDEDPMER